ncbi:MAG TPA: indolepyruvate ferredoxin oxidoreductase [Desulfobacteraceae bacterium]|jgi:indolepyruvate ferredoxin oxidoreductase, beta subunit|nr:indolepyruvate ferredoxin oxidoreductase [Desulfobacteraceae bacterium]
MQPLNIVVCGLGGQGILFVTRILGRFALDHGYSVLGAETHGMAQRGGSVTSHLRLGDVQGSMVRRGTAGVVISLDAGEAYRNMDFFAVGGSLYVNTGEPFPVEKAHKYLDAREISVRTIPAGELALKWGAPRFANLVVLGFFSAFEEPPFSLEGLREAVSVVSPTRFREENLKMFDEGAAYAPGPL